MHELEKKSATLQEQIDDLLRQKAASVDTISMCGRQASKLTKEVALTRLAMFTRRVRMR